MTSSVTSVPDSAFLRAEDLPGPMKGTPVRLADGSRPLPSFCGKPYAQDDRLAARATFRLLYNSPGAAAESTPKGVIYQDILVFRESASAAFIRDLRAAVSGCGSQLDEVGV